MQVWSQVKVTLAGSEYEGQAGLVTSESKNKSTVKMDIDGKEVEFKDADLLLLGR